MLGPLFLYRCLFHGCPQCYGNAKHPQTQEPLHSIYQRTMKMEQDIRSMGYSVITCWEHEFNGRLMCTPLDKEYVENLDIQPRLEPRDAFMGGRTECFKLYKDAEQGMKIRYLDVCSLYQQIITPHTQRLVLFQIINQSSK